MSEEKKSPPTNSANAPLYADIAVALPVRSSYTYLVPDRFRAVVRPGAIVRVPVRGRRTEGVILDVTTETDAPLKRLKGQLRATRRNQKDVS